MANDEAMKALDRLLDDARKQYDVPVIQVEESADTIRAALEQRQEWQPVYIICHSRGPDMEFIEIETPEGRSIKVGEWEQRAGGMVRLGPLYIAAATDPEQEDKDHE